MFSKRTQWDRQENQLEMAVRKMRVSGRRILDLTRSNPTDCGFVYEAEQFRTALALDGALEYKPDALGLASAREAVAQYYKEQHATVVSSSNLLLTAGTSEAYSYLFGLLCNGEDEVLIPSPGYPLFDFLADLCDVRLVRFPLVYDHGWQIDFAALSAAATHRTRALIVVHPNNPTGHYVSAAERKQLLEFCAAQEIALIVDEVFLDFGLHANSAGQTFASTIETLTFTLSGLSKICGLPQMKLGWIATSGPQPQTAEALARLELIADTYLSVGTPVQLATPMLLKTRIAFQKQVKERVSRNLQELDRQLRRQTACSRHVCEAGWNAVLRVPALRSDEASAVELLEKHHVLVHPGHFYDFAQPGWLVVSLIVPDEEFAEGISQILAYFSPQG